MNMLWRPPYPDFASIRIKVNKTWQQLMVLTIVAAEGGGVPLAGMGFDIGGELVHWKPTGEVVTIGGDK